MSDDLMTTREVAAYLRIKERKVYDLVRSGRIPCSRVTGKWLFPRAAIDRWLGEHAQGREGAPPPVVAGSHDPLLEWCLGEADTGLALAARGSLDGLARLARGEAMVAGLHVLDAATDTYNVAAIAEHLAGHDVVAIEWAWRAQGLVVAPGNPLGLATMADLARTRARVARRQDEAGSRLLFDHLAAGVDGLRFTEATARSETEVALAVLEGEADAGLAVAAVARRLRLDFVPLARERYDLVVHRRDYFEPPLQRLLAFTRTPAFAARAAALGGYDVGGLGTVRYNAP